MCKSIPEGSKNIVLAGNPNTGKSVFFFNLTGIYADVSNYPGTTLEILSGRYGVDLVTDTPGVYGISSFNDEEKVARDIILSADLVINVVSAISLERDLFLTQQIIDAGIPLVVALNMTDEAKKTGIVIDVERLSGILGVPVVPTVAVSGKGMDMLKENIGQAAIGNITPGLERKLAEVRAETETPWQALMLLEEDTEVTGQHIQRGSRDEVYKIRRDHINNIYGEVVKETTQGVSLATRLGQLMLRPATGIPFLFLNLWVMYKVVGVLIAGTVVGFTEGTLMLGYYEPFMRKLISLAVPLDSMVGRVLAGEFGLLTMTVSYLLGLLLPLVAGFHLMLSIYEDTGYLPRVATLVDRLLSSIGLNGRGVIPIILGFGCVTMATVTTRLLGTDREKKIAIFLLGLTIPCSAQLGVIAGILAGLGPQYILLYSVVIFSVMVAAGTILSSLLPGKSSDLLIDLPVIRVPRVANVLRKTGIKTLGFLKEAAPLFALGALIISFLQLTGLLEGIQSVLQPLIVGWLGLPGEAATAFVMGIIRRDFGAAGLNSLDLSSIQSVVALVTITLFVPCIASILIIFKERAKSEAAWIWGSSVAAAFLVGGLINKLYRAFGGGTGDSVLFTTVAFGLATIAVVAVCRLAVKYIKTSSTLGS
ncbi:MAG: ferrous iron transport protein B [Desulfocucumaceae bacterium]